MVDTPCPSSIRLRYALFILASSSPSSCSSSDRGRLKSLWSRRKRKHPLTPPQWRTLFTPNGKLRDLVKFLKKVRSGGVDVGIRSEVWPFLLGVYELNSCKEERDKLTTQGRKSYEKLRRQYRKLLRCGSNSNGESVDSADSEDVVSDRESLSNEEINSDNLITYNDVGGSSTRFVDPNISDSYSTGSEYSSQDGEVSQTFFPSSSDTKEENEDQSPEVQSKLRVTDDFSTWKRIIRLDAIRANGDWIPYSRVEVSKERAIRSAEAVGLKDYEHLEPCRILHASRLMAMTVGCQRS